MKRDVLDIVKEKEFIELTSDEREGLTNYCNTEEEYNQLKQVLVGVNAMHWTNPEPKAETKDSLDVLFAQSYPKAAPVWYSSALTLIVPKHKPFQRQPLVQIAAVGLLALFTVPFFGSDADFDRNKVVVAENQMEKEEDVSTNTSDVSSEQDLQEVVSEDGKIDEPTDILADPVTINTPTTRPAKPFLAAGNGGSNAVSPGSNHPDGVFIGEEAISYSLPASEQPDDLLDLLTTTF